MPFKCLSFLKKRRDGSSNPPAASTGGGAVQPSQLATPNHAPPSTDVAVASPTPLTATLSSTPSSGRILERLWNKAYDSLKTEEASTVLAYETLLAKRLEELNQGSSLPTRIQITSTTLKQPEHLEKFITAGLEESRKIANAKENVKEFSRVAQPVKSVMDVVVKAAPEAALAWSCISFALQILANPLTESSVNREGITYVLMTMKWYRHLVDLLIDDDSRTQELRNDLENYIVELYKTLLVYQMKSVCRYNLREVYVLLRDTVKLDDWKGKLDDVKEAEEHVHSKIKEYQSFSIRDSIRALAGDMRAQFDDLTSAVQEQTRTQEHAQDQSKRQNCLSALRQVDPQDEKERIQDEKGNLLRDCYSWILDHERFLDWHQNRLTRILWITGDPGKGKTMLLCGIIDELEKKPTNILSYFFCQATQETLSNATAVLRGIIYGLAKKYPQLDRHISEKYENGGGTAAFAGGTSWVVMRNILKAMLSDPYMDGVILIVDALDECVEGRQKLMEFICESSADSRAKWILSSRNWSEIEKAMGKVTTHTSKISLESNDSLVADAVGKYIEQKVKELATRTPFAGNQDLCNEVTDCLNQNSEKTFLWVALVCNALGEDNVLDKRHVSGSKGILNEFPQGLDNLYGRMLRYIKSDARDKDLCKHVLALTSVMKRHVSLQELHSIMAFSTNFDGELETLESVVRCCGSFLSLRRGIVYFVHQSAVDFLHSDEKEAFKEIFPRGIQAVHRDVFISSIKATSNVVRRNIYGLRDSHGREALAVHRDEITTPQSAPLSPIHYPSLHWIDHLSESEMPIRNDDSEVVLQFLRHKLLYWLEALALLHQLSQGIQSIQKLQKLVARMANPDEEGLSAYLHDTNRFLLYHRYMIENTPLQLYASALMFSPEQSIVRKQFWFETPEWVTVTQGVDAEWDTCLQTLFGHGNVVSTVAYSPDGQWLVSGDWAGTVKLWHMDSGNCVHTIEYCEEDPVKYGRLTGQGTPARVRSVAFSVDGQSFTSAYASGILKVFDRVRGNCIREVTTLARSEDFIIAPWMSKWTAISKDSYTVACSLGHKSIGLLNMDTNVPSRTFTPHSSNVVAVALTADGQLLASACGSRGAIEIWNTLTGESTGKIETDELDLEFTFSADGRWVATGGKSGVVRVWKSTTGELALTLNHDMEDQKNLGVWLMSFSDDGELIAVSYGSRICVWNTTTSALAWNEEVGSEIYSLSFSPDALHLVSGSSDDTIKVWDLPKNIDNTTGSPFTERVCYSDGLHFAAYYPAVQEIGIWAGTTEADLTVKKCHENDVCAISLSPDHLSLASSSSQGQITVWDTATGDQRKTFGDYRERNSPITSLAFRGNSQLASGGFGMINLWDTCDGSHKQICEEKGKHIDPIAFSVGGQWLAYNSHNDIPLQGGGIRIWDTEEERSFRVSIDARITSLSFSADSQLLALASVERIYLWDVRSRTCTGCTRSFGSYNAFTSLQVSFDASVHRRLHTQFGFLDFSEQDLNYINAGNSEHNNVHSGDSKDDIQILLGENPSCESPSFSGYGFSYDLGWVTQDQRRLFQIPFDYQAPDFLGVMTPAICGSTLIWISKRGRLLRMHFNKWE